MRLPRIRPVQTDTFMHVYNRIAGPVRDFPFGRAEKEQFIRRVQQLTKLYVIEIIAYQVMGNHFHLLVYVPSTPPSAEEAAKRYSHYHDGKKVMYPDSPAAQALAGKLRNISEFMKDLQDPFARWFNKTRPSRRRGHVWSERFKSTILESGRAVWDCWKYIEMNPVRAKMVQNPADYRFCSYGSWCGRGKHPFEETIQTRALPWLTDFLQVKTLKELKKELRRQLVLSSIEERQGSQAALEAMSGKAAEKQPFVTGVNHRVRYWVDGLVIGSDIFVKTIVGTARGELAVRKRRLTRALSIESSSADTAPPIYSYKQLRVIV